MEPLTLFTKNGGFGRWKLMKDAEVVLTVERLYSIEYAHLREPCLLCVQVLEVEDNIKMGIPFLKGDLKQFC